MRDKNTLQKLDWEEIIMNVGQPVWDKKNKQWRVLIGYKRVENSWLIQFTDSWTWLDFNKAELYLKEC